MGPYRSSKSPSIVKLGFYTQELPPLLRPDFISQISLSHHCIAFTSRASLGRCRPLYFVLVILSSNCMLHVQWIQHTTLIVPPLHPGTWAQRLEGEEELLCLISHGPLHPSQLDVLRIPVGMVESPRHAREHTCGSRRSSASSALSCNHLRQIAFPIFQHNVCHVLVLVREAGVKACRVDLC